MSAQETNAARRSRSHKQWTREKMAVFLRELAATQDVKASARAVGMSRQSAYRLRNKLKHTPFDLGWEAALELGYSQLAHAVMDRAVNGEEVVHYYRGEVVGTSQKYDNNLARWMLENPWKVGRHQVAREYTSAVFETLLERVEVAALGWEEGEPLPGRTVDLGEEDARAREAERRFTHEESWYGAQVPAPDPRKPRR